MVRRFQISLLTALRQRSNKSKSASVCSSMERDCGFPEKPAEFCGDLPKPVVTAMNFISSSATSSLPRAAAAGVSGVDVGGSSSAIRLILLHSTLLQSNVSNFKGSRESPVEIGFRFAGIGFGAHFAGAGGDQIRLALQDEKDG